MREGINCQQCGKKLCGQQRKFCSKNCGQNWRYKNDEKVRIGKRKWSIENPEKQKISSKKALAKFRKEKPERFNELMMRGYRKHKTRWQSRVTTGNVLKGRHGVKKYNLLKKECKKCGSKTKLEIHHETYPTKVKEIKKAIDDGKIYYVCLKCHGRGNGHLKRIKKQ